ncbi:MAG: hypothetical protein KAS96_10140 [Planctomycetes bacterium]|nr:hypothetical protein [Planctomycetota bacterium]
MIIKAITKNSKVLDTYTVYFFDDTFLTLSPNCDSCQGVSQMGEGGLSDGELDYAANSDLKLSKDELLINFFDLPVKVQEHVKKRILEGNNDE